MLDKLKAIVTSQSNYSALALIAIIYLLMRQQGIDLIGLGDDLTKLVGQFGALAAAVKLLLKDAPTVPPGAVTLNPPVEVTPLTAAGQAAVADAAAKQT